MPDAPRQDEGPSTILRLDQHLWLACADSCSAPVFLNRRRNAREWPPGLEFGIAESHATRPPGSALDAAAASGTLERRGDGSVPHWMGARRARSISDTGAVGPVRAGRGLPKAGGRALAPARGARSAPP